MAVAESSTSLQVHHRGGLPRPHHAGGDNGKKPLRRLLDLGSGGDTCRRLNSLHHRALGPTPPLRHLQLRGWIVLLDHRLHP